MAIRFACECGQSITARSEYAGRKVQCTGCKKILLVPGVKASAPAAGPSKPTPPPARRPEPAPATQLARSPAQTMEETEPQFAASVEEPEIAYPVRASAGPRAGQLRFRCACRAAFQASPEHAGQPTRCTRCNEVLFIPGRDRMNQTDGQPVQVAFDRKDRYRPTCSSDPSAFRGILLVFFVLLLMGGGGYAYWEFYLREQTEKEPKSKAAIDPSSREGEEPAAKALDLIPPTALGFVSIRVGEGWNSPATRQLMTTLPPDFMNNIKGAESEYGLPLRDVDRLILVVPQKGNEAAWFILASKTDLDREKIRKALKVGDPARDEQQKGKGRIYFRPSRRNRYGIRFVNNRLAVIGTQNGLEDHLSSNSRADRQGSPLERGFKAAEGPRAVVVAGSLPAVMVAHLKSTMPKDFAGALPVLELASFVATAEAANPATLVLEIEYPDGMKARVAADALKGLVGQALVLIAMGKEFPPEMKTILSDMLKGAGVEPKETRVTLSVPVDPRMAFFFFFGGVQKVRDRPGPHPGPDAPK